MQDFLASKIISLIIRINLHLQEKGHLAFNCPPKYENNIRKISKQTNKENSYNTGRRDGENKTTQQASNVNEFAGLTHKITKMKQEISNPIILQETRIRQQIGIPLKVSYTTS